MNISPRYRFSLVHEEHCLKEGERRDGAVVDGPLYERIVALSQSAGRKVTSYSNVDSTSFCISPEDPLVKPIFGLLAERGLTPRFQYCLQPQESRNHFTVRTGWEPSRRQQAQAEYFQITALLYDSSNVGTLLGMDSDHLAHVSANKEQWKRPQELAELHERFFMVSERFRQKFEKAGLVGLKLHEVQWYYQAPGFGWDVVDPIDDPRGRKWLSSSVVLPPCLTPRRYLDGPKVGAIVKDRKPSHRHCFDSEGLAPAILRYKRADVEKRGAFDLAITRERTHQTREYMGPNEPLGFRDADCWMPDIIVSRRFKEWFSKSGLHGCKRIQYRLVELVG